MRQQGWDTRGGRNARSCRPTIDDHQAASPSPAPPYSPLPVPLSWACCACSLSTSAANCAAWLASSRANSSAESLALRSAMLNVTVVDPAATSRIGLWSS